MPITPLHLGLMAPFTYYWARSWVALISFTLVNLWIDSLAIQAVLTGQPLPSHDEVHHTLVGALMVAVVVALPAVFPGFRSLSWASGAFFGAISHIFLDALVHPELQPLPEFVKGNPLYLEAMIPVSLALVPLTSWLIAQIVSGTLRLVRRRRERRAQQRDQQSF